MRRIKRFEISFDFPILLNYALWPNFDAIDQCVQELQQFLFSIGFYIYIETLEIPEVLVDKMAIIFVWMT